MEESDANDCQRDSVQNLARTHMFTISSSEHEFYRLRGETGEYNGACPTADSERRAER
jgi:hypothetical protein